MDMEICECVGICETDDKGNIIKIERKYFQQGWIFKDWGAFRDKVDAPCYVSELDDTVYTRQDFLALCNNQEEIAEELFEQLDWQSPSPFLMSGRIWERLEPVRDVGSCSWHLVWNGAHTVGFFIGHVTNAWVVNELLGSKIAELEEGVHDEIVTTEI